MRACDEYVGRRPQRTLTDDARRAHAQPRFDHTGEFEYHVVPVDDDVSEPLLAVFAECFDFIDRGLAGGRTVLVHWCADMRTHCAGSFLLRFTRKLHHICVCACGAMWAPELIPRVIRAVFDLDLFDRRGTSGHLPMCSGWCPCLCVIL